MARTVGIRSVAAFLLYLGSASVANAQSKVPTVQAVCRDGYAWMDNEEGQSPCVVYAYLQASCLAGNWTVPALPQNAAYMPPSPMQANACTCSSVTYSTMAACGTCQGSVYTGWGAWIQNCNPTVTNAGKFVSTIPANTSVPKWAFIDPTTSGTFNLTLAQEMAAQHQPDIRGSDGNINTSTDKPKSHSTTAIAIAVGIVGGLVFLVALGGTIAFLFYKRRKRLREVEKLDIDMVTTGAPTIYEDYSRSTSVPPPYVPVHSHSGSEITPYVDEESAGEKSSGMTSYFGTSSPPRVGTPSTSAAGPSAWAPIRLYDPDDPSTYPPSMTATRASLSQTEAGRVSHDLLLPSGSSQYALNRGIEENRSP
ncbi:hypothetical protein BOTBODRAFT_29515 [Botryobasidium botryosum FD-172 SS1]|uniref:Uncharacterized protein n=1 Tax=Botryobasidium botryosum (strain FD-172 SS1) TaxID=930990 RepID=A0A067MTZ0_BOTB1|nr:hypothetical protein BOTBODRAFT_29515 [Botryobasidium botryosum FD-172 SS1]